MLLNLNRITLNLHCRLSNKTRLNVQYPTLSVCICANIVLNIEKKCVLDLFYRYIHSGHNSHFDKVFWKSIAFHNHVLKDCVLEYFLLCFSWQLSRRLHWQIVYSDLCLSILRTSLSETMLVCQRSLSFCHRVWNCKKHWSR